MKKNILLYVLLAFLIIVNGIFIFLFLAGPPKNDNRKGPGDFIMKRLEFNDQQIVKFHKLSEEFENKREVNSIEIKSLKDQLFDKISDEVVTDAVIDSITNLIGKKEQAKDLLVFNHFKEMRALCNDTQKIKFDKIIKEALHKGARPNGPPPPKP